MTKRPVTITIIAALFILVGLGGLVRDSMDLPSLAAHHDETVWIATVHGLAILAGAFLLRGDNWARWLAIAWMSFHVAISFGGPVMALLIHIAFLALFVYFLFFGDARAFFRRTRTAA
jgi:hypothetical protein